MNRRELLKAWAALGVGGAALPWLSACAETGQLYADFEVNFSGRVLVIGAGASGLGAAYLLDRYGVDFEVLEAGPTFGGRVKRTDDFADFPLDLGAEWIHEDPSVLSSLIDDPSVSGSVDVVPYSPDTIYQWRDGRLMRLNGGSNFYSEYKFKSTTWHSFLETYFAPSLEGRVRFDTQITAIDSSGDEVVVTDASGNTYVADRVLLTVPITVLQSADITFTPELPQAKRGAIDSITMPDGLKASFEFSERFYPDLLAAGEAEGDAFSKLFIDGAFRKDTERHVMNFFCVGPDAVPYAAMGDDEAIAQALLDELDEIFDGKASETLVQVLIQNWSAEPFIRGSYGIDFAQDEAETVAALIEPVEDKLFFSGEATSPDNGATVPGAMQSGFAAVREILRR